MRCPYCGNPDTRVIDSRCSKENSSEEDVRVMNAAEDLRHTKKERRFRSLL